MKIKIFIDDINMEDIQLKDIRLSSQNPRYTTLNSIHDDIIEIIKDSSTGNEKSAKKTLLKYEGDFSDWNNLLQSIYDIGFDTKIEHIILVKDNDNYVVAEGNRRILCLKIIYGNLYLDKLEDIEDDINYEKDFLLFDDLDDDGYKQRRKENYKNVVELIPKIKEKYDNTTINVYTKIAKNKNELWQMIYTKHIAGERPGMRKWNRGKYFTDILSFFKSGIKYNDDLFKKIRRLLQREPNVIVEDFKHAQFVREVLKRAKIYTTNNVNEITNEMIFKEIKGKKVSALQSNFSLKRVKDSAKDFLNISYKEFENRFLKISYNENNILFFENDNKLDEILELIYVNYRERIITTRPIKDKFKDQFNLDVKKVLMGTKINTQEIQSPETLKKIDSFDFSIEDLNNIIETAKISKIDDNIIKRFESTRDIKSTNNRMKKVNNRIFNIYNDTNPTKVFTRLKNQYLHNQRNQNFLNAMGSTLRSILEQFIVWGGYFVDDIVKAVVSGNQTIFQKREIYIQKIARNNIYEIFKIIKTHKFKISLIFKMLHSITQSTKDEEIKFIFYNKDDINKVLNEFIHASHRIYDEKVFRYYLEKFALWQKNLLNIMQDIDASKIDSLGDKIKSYIESKS